MVGIARIPEAEGDFHGGLRVLVICAEAVARFQHPDSGTVDEPGELRRRPVEGVGAEGGHGRGDGGGGGVVVCARDAFAEEVGLHDGVVGAAEFPVDFVEGV